MISIFSSIIKLVLYSLHCSFCDKWCQYFSILDLQMLCHKLNGSQRANTLSFVAVSYIKTKNCLACYIINLMSEYNNLFSQFIPHSEIWYSALCPSPGESQPPHQRGYSSFPQTRTHTRNLSPCNWTIDAW